MPKSPFIIKVNELLREIGSRMEISFEEKLHFEEKQPFEMADKVKVELVITNSEQTLVVTGQVKSQLFLKCSRCGKNFVQPFSLEIEEQFATSEKIKKFSGTIKQKLTKEDFIFQISADETIDLKELIRQNILMNLPIKPLCSPECPRVDKSVPEKADPRLAGLRELKIKLKEKK